MAEKTIKPMNSNESLAFTSAVGEAIKAALPPNAALVWDVEGLGTLALKLGKVHAENLGYALVHGFLQRIGDAAALGNTWNKKLGRVPTLEDKRDSMQRLISFYESGDVNWTVERVGFGPRVDETLEFLVKALSHKDGWDADKARAWLLTKDKAGRAQIATDRNLPTWKFVSAELDRMKSDKSTEGLMEGF